MVSFLGVEKVNFRFLFLEGWFEVGIEWPLDDGAGFCEGFFVKIA